MKICFWTNSIFKLGGTKRVLTVLANQLVEKHDIVILTHDAPQTEDREMYHLSDKIQVVFEPYEGFHDNKSISGYYRRRILDKLNNRTGRYNTENHTELLKDIVCPPRLRARLIEYFNNTDYDAIVATALNALILAIISPELKAKTIGWQHNCYAAYVEQKGILFWKKEELLKACIPQLGNYVVLNQYDVEEFQKRLNVKVTAIDNPRSFVSEEKSKLTEKQFFVAARFVPQKGLPLLIKSFAKFCEVDSDWKLVIAGDGPGRKRLIEQIWRNGIQERVIFTGITNQVEKYYLDSSVYLLSSRWEGWGLVVVEAFEMGLPVIAYDIVPMDLLITNGEDGLIVPQFDTDMFAAAMVKLAHDEDLRQNMGKKAIQKAEKFSERKVAQTWDAMLMELVSTETGKRK